MTNTTATTICELEKLVGSLRKKADGAQPAAKPLAPYVDKAKKAAGAVADYVDKGWNEGRRVPEEPAHKPAESAVAPKAVPQAPAAPKPAAAPVSVPKAASAEVSPTVSRLATAADRLSAVIDTITRYTEQQ